MRTSFIALVAVLALPAAASAHTTLTKPAPRTLSNKQGPCGEAGGTRGTNVTTFAPGETITVEWDETVDHPGHYRIAFDPTGENFSNPVGPDDNFPNVLMDQIADRVGGGHYTQDVTLPNVECDTCTLQLIQIMTTQVPYNSFYFQCADITLSKAGSPDAGTATGADAGADGGGGGSGGCAAGGGASGGGALLLGLALVVSRRRGGRPRG